VLRLEVQLELLDGRSPVVVSTLPNVDVQGPVVLECHQIVGVVLIGEPISLRHDV
jgi:hypothetical protein